MPLKFKYSKGEEVPAEHSAFYRERDGGFVLDVEGAVGREKLDEFRQNNIALPNQLKAFEGIYAGRARDLLRKEEELGAGGGGEGR